jgi:radical SAM superfamily enzyme YgiQ (UPF0313 family)
MEIILLTACVSNVYKLYRTLGSYQLAWYLRKFGYQVQVIDFIHRFSEDQIWKLLDKFITPETKVIGYGPMIDLNESGEFSNKIERILRKLKNRYPQIKIVAGGSAAQYLIKRYRNKSLFDTIFVGHSEDTMLAYCNHIFRGKPALAFEKLEGNVVIRENFPLPQIEEKFDISTCSHTWDKNDFIQPNETLPIELGRGCIFACKFCQYPYIGKSKNDFTREMEFVKEEIIRNFEQFGVRRYYMVEDTFNADRERTKAFTEMVKTLPFKIEYASYLRMDLIYRWQEQEELLLESGLKTCFFGIETFNEESANLIGKGFQTKIAKDYLPKLIHNRWKDQINPRLGLICGLPPETFDELWDTHRWLVDNNIPSWNWFPLQINRDMIHSYTSEFERNAESYGFEFESDRGRIIWKHKEYNQCQAEDEVIKLNNASKPYTKPSWAPLMELGNFVEDIDYYRTKTHDQLDWSDVVTKRNEFLKNYYLQLLRS